MPIRFLLPAIRFVVLFMIPMALSASGATASWHLTAAPVSEDGGGFPRCEKAPAQSVFFEPGDELWDLSGWMQSRYAAALAKPEEGAQGQSLHEMFPALGKWQGDWIVWNVRSRCIVAGGSWNDLCAVGNLSGFDNQQLQVRTIFRLKTGQGEKLLSGVSNRDQAGWIEAGLISCSYETAADRDHAVLSLTRFTWPASEPGVSWNAGGVAVELNDREQKGLMRRKIEGDGEDELFASLRIEALDGTPFSECRWKEEAGRSVEWRWQRLESPLADGTHLIMSGHRGEGLLARSVNEQAPGSFRVIEAPLELREWVRGPLIDLSSGAMSHAFPQMKLMSYDPVSARLIAVGTAADTVKLDEGSHGIVDPPGPFVWAEVSSAGDAWGLAACANTRAAVFRTKGEDDQSAFELALDAKQEEMAIHCEVRFSRDQHLEADAVCHSGELQGISQITGADGRPAPVKLLLRWTQ